MSEKEIYPDFQEKKVTITIWDRIKLLTTPMQTICITNKPRRHLLFFKEKKRKLFVFKEFKEQIENG